MRLISLLGVFALVAATGGCAIDTSSSEGFVKGQGDEDVEECKIEGADIGRVGATAQANGDTIVFEAWIAKQGAPGEYVGFVLSDSVGDRLYHVKAGTNVYLASGATWSHPEGDSGPDANAISNVDFCECDYDDYDEDGDGVPDID